MILIRTILTVLVLIGAIILLPLLLTDEDFANHYISVFSQAFYIATDIFIIVLAIFALAVQWG